MFIWQNYKRSCAVHTVYPDYFKDNLKRRVLQNNSPFSCPIFKDIDSRNDLEEASKTKECFASSGM